MMVGTGNWVSFDGARNELSGRARQNERGIVMSARWKAFPTRQQSPQSSQWQHRAEQMFPGARIVGDGPYAARMPCRVFTMRLFQDPEESDRAFLISRALGFTCGGRCDELKPLVDPGPHPVAQCCRIATSMVMTADRIAKYPRPE